jgi:hypothetical protein
MVSASLSPGVDHGVAHRDSDRPDLAAAGDETSSTNENHVILDGRQRREAATHRLCIQGPPKP